MSAMPVLWIVWAGVAVVLLILLGYRGTLTRYEEDQIFLDDCQDHQAKEQNELLQKVKKIQPYVSAAIAATCVLSAAIIGIYVWDAIKHLT
jgi:purine-cytosine permease-like protein